MKRDIRDMIHSKPYISKFVRMKIDIGDLIDMIRQQFLNNQYYFSFKEAILMMRW